MVNVYNFATTIMTALERTLATTIRVPDGVEVFIGEELVIWYMNSECITISLDIIESNRLIAIGSLNQIEISDIR